ncbi:phosphotransferase enzyme family protein [Kitasatospora sp. NPDC057500]|uniref:phosphotransferase enzyme family protein n=1 Tax=Kitasatospora sp. NPDC057500 TaxID=3346151 RepID=UPI0036B593D7
MARSFYELSRSTQRARLRASAVRVAEVHGIRCDDLRLVQYEDNAVYRLAGRRRGHPESILYTLRISVRDGRSAAEQRSELDWMEALLAEEAVTVPVPVATPAGDKVVGLELAGCPEPVTAAVFEWIPGRASPPYSRPGAAGDIGAVTARLHEHAAGFRPPAGFVRPVWGHREVFTEGAALDGATARGRLTEDEQRVLQEVSAAVGARLPEPGSADWGVIHADLHRGNLLETDDGSTAVIDFDDCGWGFPMLDVATVLSSVLRTCADDRPAYEDFAERYLAGYRSVRALPAGAAQFDEFLVMRDLIILNFVLGSENAAVLGWGPQRARGILGLLRTYLETGEYAGHLDLLP